MQVKTLKFRQGSISISYPPDYYPFLKEQYIFDIYRSHLLKDGDLVLDLGANIGAFTILASRKVGRHGKVIAVEPNKIDYDLLRKNLDANNCRNVMDVNEGVSDHSEIRDMNFWGRNFRCNMRTLTEIMQDIHIDAKINFIKMDIEGYETSVIKSSLEIFGDTDVVSIECHDNRSVIDKMLYPLGFTFYPITMSYLAKNLSRNAILHPLNSIRASVNILKQNPKIFYKILSRQEYYGHSKGPSDTVVGSYAKFSPF